MALEKLSTTPVLWAETTLKTALSTTDVCFALIFFLLDLEHKNRNLMQAAVHMRHLAV